MHHLRSTKAGARTPATPRVIRRRIGPSISLNEGRGANPGDTRVRISASRPAATGAQRRPGREPRRHPRAGSRRRARGATLNEGRGANPGDTPVGCLTRPQSVPLNEGRGANPGDTSPRTRSCTCPRDAQRRPGREPRRHRGPSRSARGAARRALNEGRGANPGDTPHHPVMEYSYSSLNEGRGANPGDTSFARAAGTRIAAAQRRPGREPRRHPGDPAAPRD